MRVTVERPSKEWQDKVNTLFPGENIEVSEYIEFEIPWYSKDYWLIRFWAFLGWVCETIVPSLKDEPNFIWIGQRKYRGKTNRTK